ncbi:DUF1971 domain-containing protein [Erythrobacter sp. SN021]|uniref:DUF1971 domain-containing protein n=1 Tax=Erythrobacter sp. SN021 TaxID=2912574 RepID=UPI001F21B3D4|nr:DUF1971 domain-containing protein [Erythrobacter sp. SN021]MCF8881485.1 DUF1971 domain-containing protein [Erythrobacter sp. SN021]
MSEARLKTYRQIGPFDETSLPAGLLAEHRLKPGTWGRLEMIAGAVMLVWDDEAGGRERLSASDIARIPPQRPHHLEPEGPFTLSIAFQRPA